MSPSVISKLNTFLQILLVLVILVSLGYSAINPQIIQTLVGLTLLTTIVSGVHYGWVWGKNIVRK